MPTKKARKAKAKDELSITVMRVITKYVFIFFTFDENEYNIIIFFFFFYQAVQSKYKIVVAKTDDMVIIKRTDYSQTVRPHIIACVIKNVTLDVENMKKFIQLQTRLHEGICDKRNAATIATHDLDLCKGRKFTYTAVSPDGLKITPLSRNREFSGRGME